MDAVVRDIYQRTFPDRTVVKVDVTAIAEGGGGIHCITQQEPA
jgi:agmatine deiminase